MHGVFVVRKKDGKLQTTFPESLLPVVALVSDALASMGSGRCGSWLSASVVATTQMTAKFTGLRVRATRTAYPGGGRQNRHMDGPQPRDFAGNEETRGEEMGKLLWLG